ncbi:MAG: adenylyl-sulfate kinase, partial [Thermocrispum sp.]
MWLTGLPSSGKSTIAAGLAKRLVADGVGVEVLDGDEMRRTITQDLGFSRSDRHENVLRFGRVALLLARNGIVALVPVIAPYSASRDEVRGWHGRQGVVYFEAHVSTPVEVCGKRDVKGLYAAHAAGTVRGHTGVDDPYERPTRPDLRVDTQYQS